MFLFNKIMVLQTSCDMNKDDYGTNELVNVNWGSKSTQFHGEGMRDKRVVKEVCSFGVFIDSFTDFFCISLGVLSSGRVGR